MTAPVVLDFARDLAAVLAELRSDLVGVYLHGSAALGGFVPARSDVDILVVVEESSDAEGRRKLGEAIAAAARDCPGVGLELSVITAATARELGSCQYEVHVNTTGTEAAVVIGGDSDTDLILHCAVCRAHAVAVAGPPAEQVFGEVSRDRIVRATLDELDWALEHAPTTYAVLNACRALRFAVEGIQCSKVEAAGWYLERHPDNPVVLSALAAQRGDSAEPPGADEAKDFVRGVTSQLVSL
ncbi:aminoglycoside adenylyltransferase domain-containing protein [Kribbella sp. CA-294648]|uniref:aminoglycoside adenylyltransferase domain-containing protein n=1 Tax=Kribbella sp. CA-294648 TaxID=3239948 RepID=UPI003D8D0B60